MVASDITRWLKELERLRKHKPLKRIKHRYLGAKGLPVITKPGNASEVFTGSWRVFKPVRDKSKCVRCGLCVVFCPEAAIVMKRYPETNYHICKGCGICAHECPTKAIAMVRDTHGEKL